jgi:thioredoxin-like negative regulator of GroEL
MRLALGKEKHIMKIQISRGLLLAATLATTGLALAQGGGGQGQGQGGGNRPNFRNMTPEQRQQYQAQMQVMMAQQREQQLRAALTTISADAATQDAVVAFVKLQSEAATALTPKIAAMRAAFAGNATDTAVTAALADYRASVEEARKTRETQTAALDKQISFSTKPKLEALLTMLGIIGDETSFVSNLSGDASLPGAGGRGGRGGMGGRGGQGGRNGGRRQGGGMTPPAPVE